MAPGHFPHNETRAAGTNCDAIRVSTTSTELDLNDEYIHSFNTVCNCT